MRAADARSGSGTHSGTQTDQIFVYLPVGESHGKAPCIADDKRGGIAYDGHEQEGHEQDRHVHEEIILFHDTEIRFVFPQAPELESICVFLGKTVFIPGAVGGVCVKLDKGLFPGIVKVSGDPGEILIVQDREAGEYGSNGLCRR